MKVLIFNGSPEYSSKSASGKVSGFITAALAAKNVEVIQFNIGDADIPLFELNPAEIPQSVNEMNHLFRSSDLQLWLTPLYHGSMTGVMKNCLDWLEYGNDLPNTYLEGSLVGFVCWAGGMHGVNGINAMDQVAKALRAWTLPFSVPMQYADLFDERGELNGHYKTKLGLLVDLLIKEKH
ncbi:NADPH-dependent FMN reductase [Crocinitomix algicola]|uniref:NADPH-dependent FMN reductase n=1 Tax=Crocinitomix algicola TaxID=1740263 RepID=UPI0008727BAF|nr:NAD(P)H-dependent oxidoreductase [Crocinitomix algicola]